jgi:hypothetical protein
MESLLMVSAATHNRRLGIHVSMAIMWHMEKCTMPSPAGTRASRHTANAHRLLKSLNSSSSLLSQLCCLHVPAGFKNQVSVGGLPLKLSPEEVTLALTAGAASLHRIRLDSFERICELLIDGLKTL